MTNPKARINSALVKITKTLANYPQHSRVHLLKNFPAETSALCYIKRDDELGFGISGSKLRKYLSLMPWLTMQKFEEAILLGGIHSNHILSMVQLLIENQIKPVLLIHGESKTTLCGNLLFTSLFVPKNDIHWLGKTNKHNIQTWLQEYLIKNSEKKIVVVPEGAFMPEALPGALTLALDILKNEQEMSINFDHVFIDAGTGLIAIATILVFALLKKNICIHIVLLADSAPEFLTKLEIFKSHFETLTGLMISKENLHNIFKLYSPQNAKAFGSTNSTVFNFIKRFAREQGVLLDPIYSGKLFFEASAIIKADNLKGNILIVHSGGALTLAGFQDKLL